MYNKKTYSFIDRIFLTFIFLIPLIPRPTIEHPVKFLAPLFIFILVCAFMIWALGRGRLKKTNTGLLTFILYLIILLYTFRIIGNEEWKELPYYLSRIMSYFLLLILIRWIITNRISVKAVYKSIFYGFLLLSVLVIFIGFTGIMLFGEIRPPRFYGIQMPFYKTVAIPRSYGEFGIIASVAWSYFLVYKDEYSKKIITLIIIILSLSITISQSRNTYLAIFLISTCYYLSRISKKISLLFLLFTMILPIVFGLLAVFDFNLPIIRTFMGEGIYSQNVYARSSLNDIAIKLLMQQDPLSLLLGIDHYSWKFFLYKNEGMEVSLHNHFLSNIIFIGTVGGSLNILMYTIPAFNLARNISFKEKDGFLVFLSTIGMITCLQSYEGFFSPITILILCTLWAFYGKNRKIQHPMTETKGICLRN